MARRFELLDKAGSQPSRGPESRSGPILYQDGGGRFAPLAQTEPVKSPPLRRQSETFVPGRSHARSCSRQAHSLHSPTVILRDAPAFPPGDSTLRDGQNLTLGVASAPGSASKYSRSLNPKNPEMKLLGKTLMLAL